MKRLLAVWVLAASIIGTASLASAQVDKKTEGQVHKGTGVVTKVDKDKVTIKHDPIRSLNWPAMTMAFAVKDKAMLDKVAKDKKVEFEFVQQGQRSVITSIK